MHISRIFVPAALLLAACPAGMGGSGGDIAPFQGQAAHDARLKALNDKYPEIGKACVKTDEDAKGAIYEATADAQGKVSGRTLIAKGNPEAEKCVLAAIRLLAVGPFAGPPVSTFWQFNPEGAPAPAPAEPGKITSEQMQSVKNRLDDAVGACAQRHLPQDFPADIEVTFSIFPGGRPGVANIASSTAKDGNYESCVLNLVLGETYPDPHHDGPFPVRLPWHIGPSGKI